MPITEPEETTPTNLGGVKMSMDDFRHFSDFIHNSCGIKMPPEKKLLLESRLQRRLRVLGMKNFSNYREFVFNNTDGQYELYHMIDAVTTNKTDFFREPDHFDYLVNHVLPALFNTQRSKRFLIWSAGCSTGEEPYTLAMVLNEFADQNPGFSYSILATDISTQVLEKASQATYTMDRIEPIPQALKKKYLLRHKDKTKSLVRIAPELRINVEFRRLNLMEEFDLGTPVDIIFCRNVMIYFDRPTQERLLNRYYRQLVQGGYLFLGHSETLHGMRVPFVQMKPTVYRR